MTGVPPPTKVWVTVPSAPARIWASVPLPPPQPAVREPVPVRDYLHVSVPPVSAYADDCIRCARNWSWRNVTDGDAMDDDISGADASMTPSLDYLLDRLRYSRPRGRGDDEQIERDFEWDN